MKLRALLLICGLLVYAPARAGLFSNDKQLEARIAQLEVNDKQRTQTMLDLQMQIDALTADLRTLHGQNEELVHELQDAEKRQKDFYVDLDTRLRRFETGASSPAASTSIAAPIDPVAENHDYNAAYGLFKSNKQQASITAFQDFLTKYPGSTLAPNAYYWMGVSYYALKDYKNAVNSYLTSASKYPSSPKAPSALMGAAICYQHLNDNAAAKKALKQLIKQYPDSNLVPRAKKHLARLK
jgi:tol-pal system protein YbgF